ncbi:hypothetical protein [Ectothiorhodospira shaposhnikovii]|uniref:hypothetical protein n=1 Tax=Ectothiorhodospira shaposhnikovii TaxID=1054 RepID=UPI0019086B3F|nr:hypothetical protein [Ectothiorhodospira shaposhnikovii]
MLLNWATTGDHLLKTALTDRYWAVAGVDVSLLGVALLATGAARLLWKRESAHSFHEASAAAPVGRTLKRATGKQHG